MNITLNRTVDLSSPILPEVLSAPLYEGEKNAHTFVIAAVKNKLPHPLSGSVVAYFERADGNTVRVEGEIKDGAAYVTLPPECYQTGVFYLAVMLISDGAQTVIYAASGRVRNTQDGEIINGGDAIPTYDEIMEHLNKYLNANISAKVEQKEDGVLITMTDADGMTQAFVKNGKDGSGTGGGSGGNMPAPYYITIEKVPDANGYKTSDDFDYAQMVNAYKQGRPIYITSNPFDTQTEMYAELVKLYDNRAIFSAIDPNGLRIVTVYSNTYALINGGNVTYKGQRIVGAVNNIQPSPTSFLGGINLTAADIPGAVQSVNGKPPDENGNVEMDTASYTLPIATADTLGGVKVGDGLVMVEGALGVKPEGDWETIKTITIETDDIQRIDEDTYADGNPYDFIAVYVTITVPASVATTKCVFGVNGHYASSISSISSETTETNTLCYGYIQNSRMFTRASKHTDLGYSTNGVFSQYASGEGYRKYRSITKISCVVIGAKFPEGTKITIEGVRA